MRITFATINLGRGVNRARFVRRAQAALLAMTGLNRVLGFQEIDEADSPREHHILARLLRLLAKHLSMTLALAGWDTREPIAVMGAPGGPTVVSRRVVVASKGIAGWTPMRSITEVVLDLHLGPAAPRYQLAVLCYHPAINRPQTVLARRAIRRVLRREVRAHVALGRSVVLLADENLLHPPATSPLERTLTSRGLDHVRFVRAPGGVRLEVLDQGVVDIGIDGHDLVWVEVKATVRG